MSFITYIIDNKLGDIEYGKTFKELTTIGCGGKIKWLYYPNSIKNLRVAYKYIISNNIKYFVIGNGSNTLSISDYFDGVVISMKRLEMSLVINDDYIEVSSNYSTISLAYELSKLKLGDLSFLGGIPGEMGGAIYNNSGSYKDNIANHLISLKYINTKGEIIEIKNSMCAFSYRHSIFHHINGIIISAKFYIDKIETEELLDLRKKKRMETQPLDKNSMGSIFKNNDLIESYKIIDLLNMRGYSINDAMVSEKHSNFIVNNNNASGKDILNLIELIQKRALLELGIDLRYEITLV
jgi:UDP-N-acetylmuramate dehydrogenase